MSSCVCFDCVLQVPWSTVDCIARLDFFDRLLFWVLLGPCALALIGVFVLVPMFFWNRAAEAKAQVRYRQVRVFVVCCGYLVLSLFDVVYVFVSYAFAKRVFTCKKPCFYAQFLPVSIVFLQWFVKYTRAVLFCLFLLLPGTSSRVLSMWLCKDVEGMSYMVQGE
jgi:hypothetical protein